MSKYLWNSFNMKGGSLFNEMPSYVIGDGTENGITYLMGMPTPPLDAYRNTEANYEESENSKKKYILWKKKFKENLPKGQCRLHRHQNFNLQAPGDADLDTYWDPLEKGYFSVFDPIYKEYNCYRIDDVIEYNRETLGFLNSTNNMPKNNQTYLMLFKQVPDPDQIDVVEKIEAYNTTFLQDKDDIKIEIPEWWNENNLPFDGAAKQKTPYGNYILKFSRKLSDGSTVYNLLPDPKNPKPTRDPTNKKYFSEKKKYYKYKYKYLQLKENNKNLLNNIKENEVEFLNF